MLQQACRVQSPAAYIGRHAFQGHTVFSKLLVNCFEVGTEDTELRPGEGVDEILGNTPYGPDSKTTVDQIHPMETVRIAIAVHVNRLLPRLLIMWARKWKGRALI